jgi:hypothetical protein
LPNTSEVILTEYFELPGVSKYWYRAYILCVEGQCCYINPLKTKHICSIQGLSAYRAVNTLHFGCKNQSLHVL